MPELPEIETVRMQLSQVLPGRKLIRVEVRSEKIAKSSMEILVGKKITGVRRRAKVLLVIFEGDLVLALHFKMTGQLIYEVNEKPQETNLKKQTSLNTQKTNYKNRIVGGHPTEDFENPMPGKHTRIIFYLNGGKLFFNDQRKFGWVLTGTNEKTTFRR